VPNEWAAKETNILKTYRINGSTLHTDRLDTDDLRVLEGFKPGTYLNQVDVVETDSHVDIVYIHGLQNNANVRRAALANWRQLADLIAYCAAGGDPTAPEVDVLRRIVGLQ
jgi:hypothetical protein